jgi:aspartate/methionine/tyrosine aminotransferase
VPRVPRLSTAAGAIRESIFARLAGRLAAHPDAVPLHLGDTYVEPPRSALELDPRPHLRYGMPAGEPALIGALVDKLARKNALHVTAAQVQVTCGATHALSCVARALFDDGDEVVTPTPHWPLIRGILTNAGARPVEVELSQKLYADPSLDPAELLRPHITDRTSGLYVTTPNNPDGKVLSRAQLESIARLAVEHDLWVLADEVYEDLLYTGEHVSIATLPGMAERTLTSFSLSKSLALAGYRLGYVVGSEAAMRAVRKIANHTVYNVPAALQHAAARLVGTDDERTWREDAKARYAEARALCAERLPAAFVPDGGTYFFLDLRDRGELWPFVEQLLDDGVSISPGEQFGAAFAGHARICFAAVPLERLAIGLDRLARALSR